MSSRIPRLDQYVSKFDRGRPWIVEAVWLLLSTLFVSSSIPGSRHRAWLLRLFGATVGPGVVIKPRVLVKFPWRLTIKANSWIGEGAWIDNLDHVIIGENVCISQGVYFCTGNHDWTSPTFELITAPICVEDGGWIAARAVVGPGVTICRNAVIGLGAVITESISAGGILVAKSTKIDKQRALKVPDKTI